VTTETLESRARLLISLYEQGESGSTVTRLAHDFGLSKTSISRAVNWLEKNDLVRREDTRHIMLSAYGQMLAKGYRAQRDTAREWMLLEGLPEEKADDEAMAMAIGAPTTISVIAARAMALHAIKQRLREKRDFSGSEFCAALDNGNYQVNFFFYRSGNGVFTAAPSMANDGFEQPADLDVKGDEGTITLHARAIERPIEEGSKRAVGVLRSLRYRQNGRVEDARQQNFNFSIPVSVLEFQTIGDGALYQGKALMQMACSGGLGYMPESDALFVMFF
jgi:Mn-dependent DtxR family transcriptional regulator